MKCLMIAALLRKSGCVTMVMATQPVTWREREARDQHVMIVYEDDQSKALTALLISAIALKFGISRLLNFFGQALLKHSSTVIFENNRLSRIVSWRAISRGSTSRNLIFFRLRGTTGGGAVPADTEAVSRRGAPVIFCCRRVLVLTRSSSHRVFGNSPVFR